MHFYINNIFGKLVEVKKGLFIVITVVISIAIFACKKKKEPVKQDVGADYYPAKTGRYVVYDVDSIVFDEFTFDSTHYKYQIKEKIEEEYTDQQNRPALKLVRYIKKFNAAVSYSAMPWAIKDVWQVNVSNKNVEVVEENIRFVKLIFPVKEKNTWDGNITNTLGEWMYKYSYVNNPETINGNFLENVTLIIQKHFPTKISREDYSEKYAKNIGMVYREIIDLAYGSVYPEDTPWQNIANKSGVVYHATVVSYGNE